MLERILGIILPVFSVIALGWLYARRAKPDMAWVNRISMNVLAPALIFSALASKDFDVCANGRLIARQHRHRAGLGTARVAGRALLHVDSATFVPPMMFNNCGNMGLPLAVLAFGRPGFSAMVALFTISNLLHFTLGVVDHRSPRALRPAAAESDGVVDDRSASPSRSLHPPLPEWADARDQDGRRRADPDDADLARRAARSTCAGATGASASSAASSARSPASRWRRCSRPLLGLDATQRGLLILFGCLPPAVLNFMVAEQFRQEPGKVASIVLIGNVLSVVFVPLGLALALK